MHAFWCALLFTVSLVFGAVFLGGSASLHDWFFALFGKVLFLKLYYVVIANSMLMLNELKTLHVVQHQPVHVHVLGKTQTGSPIYQLLLQKCPQNCAYTCSILNSLRMAV